MITYLIRCRPFNILRWSVFFFTRSDMVTRQLSDHIFMIIFHIVKEVIHDF